MSSEKSALLDRAHSVASEVARRDVELLAEVDHVVQSRDEALQVLQQLQTAIQAGTTSAIASVLRAGVESDGRKQNVEDAHARALACRQLSCMIAGLRNLDDASLLKEIAFVRNLIRSTELMSATVAPSVLPAPSMPAQGRQSAASGHHLLPRGQLAIASHMQNVIEQGKQLIHAFEEV